MMINNPHIPLDVCYGDLFAYLASFGDNIKDYVALRSCCKDFYLPWEDESRALLREFHIHKWPESETNQLAFFLSSMSNKDTLLLTKQDLGLKNWSLIELKELSQIQDCLEQLPKPLTKDLMENLRNGINQLYLEESPQTPSHHISIIRIKELVLRIFIK